MKTIYRMIKYIGADTSVSMRHCIIRFSDNKKMKRQKK